MKHRQTFVLLLSLATVLVVTGLAVAGGQFSAARHATAQFRDVDVAIAAGYTLRLADLTGATCIEQPGQGGMGVHMVNPSLLDGTIDEAAPEVLVYEEKSHGRLKLVAVEYVVFASDWTGAHPPSLFGHEFEYVGEPNRFGLPPFYALHAWIWKKNPSGILAAWNPNVSCGH